MAAKKKPLKDKRPTPVGREAYIGFRLKESERKKVARSAKKHGMSMSSWVRAAVIEQLRNSNFPF